MAQVFALQPDRGAAGPFGQPVGAIHRGGPAAEAARKRFELAPKRGIPLRDLERGRQLLDGRHQRLRDVLPAVAPKATARIRPHKSPPPLWGGVGGGGVHFTHDPSTRRTASTNARSFAWSLRPGSASTPLQTSTPQGCSSRPAPSTVWGVNPPETTTGSRRATAFAFAQVHARPVPPMMSGVQVSSNGWSPLWNLMAVRSS